MVKEKIRDKSHWYFSLLKEKPKIKLKKLETQICLLYIYATVKKFFFIFIH